MKNKIITYSFSIFLISFMVLNIVSSDKDISSVERRKLQQLPKINIDNILNGEFFNDFDKYTLDQFIYRDSFRNIKSYINFNIYKKLDNNNLYIDNNYIYKIEYPVNDKSINNFISVINSVRDNYLDNTNNIYISIIPDKNYYASNKYLKMDYNYLINKVIDNTNMNYINIIDRLSIDDYYKTDAHWMQNKIIDIANYIRSSMNTSIDNNYIENIDDKFYGVYYGQLGLNINSDKLIWLSNEVINNSTVFNYESEYNKIYNISKLDGYDKYDLYLSGATPYIELINNTNPDNKKELVIFRDSFGSSIAPLLLSGYSKISLIDIRYTNVDSIKDLIEFKNKDILFLYSTSLINNSTTLRK